MNDEYTITVIDEDNFTLDGVDSSAFDGYTFGGQVVRNRYYRTKAWKRIIAGGVGNLHQMKISTTGSNSAVKIEDYKPVFKRVGRRVIN